ncbi:MAG: tRNA1(Val) (adenine(37)-N6)-methyltransferase [Lachnospiraceae bacterium]|nr:tRNA1(Val) (adenine(37)-N6)-methyltransferase [Candidatus Equihabitans merdae]
MRLDDLGDGRYIYQNENGFCFGIDAVLLAHFAKLRRKDCVLDLCTGNGVIPLIMEKEAPDGAIFHGLELQEGAVELARQSVALNGLEEKIVIDQGNVCEAASIYGAASFNVVTVNPPYRKKGNGAISEGDARAIARHEMLCTLEDVVREASLVLKSNGHFYMIHLPERLQEIMAVMQRYGLAVKSLRMVQPFAQKAPNLVLIAAVKGGALDMKVDKPLVVYQDVNVYTDEVMQWYQDSGVAKN